MFSFIVEKKVKAALSVTSTYMNLVKESCAAVDEVEYIPMGEHAKHKDSYIVTDTIQAAFFYICKGYKNHIVWMQGVAPEESYMRHKSKLRYHLIGIMEKLVLKKAKLLLLVSDEMRVHYETKYKLNLAEKSVIMPCFNENGVVEGAFNDSKYKENSFVYVGSLDAWQCFEQTVKLYSTIERLSAVPTKFYVYTFQQNRAKEMLAKYDVKHYEVDCVDKEQLSERIKSMKYGFVLREDCTVNNVATPTKFSNYLANGIIPVYSSAIGSFSAFDQTNQLGVVYNLENKEDGVHDLLAHMQTDISAAEVRRKCVNAFETYYNSKLYIQAITDKVSCLIK